MTESKLPQRWEMNQEAFEWRLQLFSNDTATQKISLLQKLLHASLPVETKIYLLLDNLQDAQFAVQEAVMAALYSMGLNPRIASALKRIFQDDISGIDVLTEFVHIVQPFDVLVAGISILRLLEKGKNKDIEQIIKGLYDLSTHCTIPTAILAKLVHALLDTHFINDKKNYLAMTKLFVGMAQQMPTMYLLLWEEIRLRQTGPKRRFLLKILGEMSIARQDEEEFWHYILDIELELYIKDSQGIYYFETVLLRNIERVLPVLCAKLVAYQYPIALLEMTGRIIENQPIPKDLAPQIGRIIIQALQKGGLQTLHRIPWAYLVQTRNIPRKWRKAFVHEILKICFEQKITQELYEEVVDVISCLGIDAFEIIGNVFFQQQYFSKNLDKGIFAIQLLHKIIAKIPTGQLQEEKRVVFFLENSLQLLTPLLQQSQIAPELQKLAGCWLSLLSYLEKFSGNKNACNKLEELLLANIWKLKYTGGAIQALGDLVISPFITRRSKQKLIDIFYGFLQRSWDISDCPSDSDARETEATSLHINWLPKVLASGTKIYATMSRNHSFHQRFLQIYIKKWHKILTWKEIWSPWNIDLLLHSLGDIGTCKSTNYREQKLIASCIFQYKNNFAATTILQQLLRIQQHSKQQSEIEQYCIQLTKEFITTFNEEKNICGCHLVLGMLLKQKILPNALQTSVLHILAQEYRMHNLEAKTIVADLVKHKCLTKLQMELFPKL